MADKNECFGCRRTEDEVTVTKCPMCYRHYCDDHSHTMNGREFCSEDCAKFFFFSAEDES